MKIIFNNTIFFSQKYGGISRYFSEIFKNLVKQKINFKIISPIYKNIFLKNLEKKYKFGFYFPRYPLFKAFSKCNEYICNSIISQSKYTIIHDTYYTYELSKIKNKKKIITIHDLIHEKFSKYYNDFDNIIDYKKKIFSNIDYFICVSENTKNDFLDIYKISEDRVKVIHHGSDHLEEKLENNEYYFKKNDSFSNKDFILYVGSRHRYKNFDLLLRAYNDKEKLHKNFNLICFGGEKLNVQEKKFIQKNNLKNKFFHIYGDDNLLKNLYSSARVFVSTSIYEGFGLNVLEAMRYGCPVILNDIKVFRELFKDYPIYYNNKESLIHNLNNILIEDKNLEKDKINLINFSKSFTWKNTVNKTLNVYKSI